jgi:protein AbiQ
MEFIFLSKEFYIDYAECKEIEKKKIDHGLDLSKSIVVVDKNKYVDTTMKPHIREDEFEELRGKDYFIKQKLETYIKRYKKALKKQELRNNNE